MSNFTTDKQAFVEAFLDCPVRALCVKSIERETPPGWPKHHGRLAKPELLQGNATPRDVAAISATEPVTVIGHNDGITEPPFVWTGTGAEFNRRPSAAAPAICNCNTSPRPDS